MSYPYLCYTEHGLHALFYTHLFNALAPTDRYLLWHGQLVCAIQKEYPTADALGKPQRQHWDVAVIRNPPQCLAGMPHSYDYLRLAAVIEFGLNEASDHLEDDIQRLSHPGGDVDQGYFVHLYRLTAPKAMATTASTMQAASIRRGYGALMAGAFINVVEICPVPAAHCRRREPQARGVHGPKRVRET